MRRPGLARFNLFVAFAFTVMADPVSSVAYAIESALRSLDDNLAALLLTMALVVGTIVVIAATYHQVVRRFPGGGGGAEAVATAFGESWAFVPLGALLVDFTLTVAVSCAAGASALVAYEPAIAAWRLPLALGLSGLVAAGIALGHRGRIVFATATLGFLALALVVIVRGAFAATGSGPAPAGAEPLLADAGLGAALLAMPLGMALATGLEAPSNAIAQLPQLGRRGRRLFGQLTIWVMVAIVGSLTLAVAALAARLGIGLPPADSTLLAEVARRATGDDAVFAAFQAASTLLLLAAAASSFAAASGLMKALALHDGGGEGLLPRRFGLTNRFLVPHWGVLAVLVAAAVLLLLSGGRDQEIVQFYAVAVFASFVAALVGSARLSYLDGARVALAWNVAGALLVGFVLVLNLTRIDGMVALLASGAVSLYLWRSWVHKGRPAGVSGIGRQV